MHIAPHTWSPRTYAKFLMAVAGFGGLLYGIDIGIIAAALLYLSKTISLTVVQTSLIVAAVLGGSMVSSLIAGLLADWIGRRRMMIAAALIFLASVGLIVLSQGFALLFAGRLLQGMSGGIIAVVIPLYLAECLGARVRGRGTAIFQWMLTFGIVVASFTGMLYTRAAENAIRLANGDPVLVHAAQDHAWRSMFLLMMYPGIVFFIGSLFLPETPRWLMRRGRPQQALASLHRMLPTKEAELQMREMSSLAQQSKATSQHAAGTLLRRKYVIPFLLACLILACNQATGINSVLGFLVVILKQAGMSPARATSADVLVKLIHCFATVIAVMLVETKGRKFLLKLGTGGIVISLIASALLFHSFESQRVDLASRFQHAVIGNTLRLDLSKDLLSNTARPDALTVLYSYGSNGEQVASVATSDPQKLLLITPTREQSQQSLILHHAFYGPIASPLNGILIAVSLGCFVSFFSLGPGVVVWLTLSELMPTRIRSTGMGLALLLNQGVSTLIAATFLPAAGTYGFSAVFCGWTVCSAIYFAVATWWLPETKGKTLEEIEQYFSRETPLPAATNP